MVVHSCSLSTSRTFAPSFDIFCKVIDNFGDVGVSYRFARQLSEEKGCNVRYIIDTPEIIKKFLPDFDPTAVPQSINGITFLLWDDSTLHELYGTPSSVVVETFGCSLPQFVVERMKTTGSSWIDLEYLSAEPWVPRFHAIPSPEPVSGLERTLFFPGFSPETGGLLREESLLEQRTDFQSNTELQNQWRERYSLPPLAPSCIDVSLFCYPTAPFATLAKAMHHAPLPVRLFLTGGLSERTTNTLCRTFGECAPHVPIFQLPFLPQQEYDRLLWTCALNFVRGEDSFVRAIWAARPFLWHIYPQDKGAHLVKLRAFLGTYGENLSPSLRASLEKLLFLWNEGGGDNFEPFALIPELAREARAFTDRVAAQTDLASALLAFLRRE
jgi:uncharacterized repeat protein (TIGR03837 family)